MAWGARNFDFHTALRGVHELDGDRAPVAQAPPHVRDAARADRRAEDRITAGKRGRERPQGFASRLRRARRAVLQEPAALAPAFSVVAMACCVLSGFYPHQRRRRDRRGTLC